jgi:hypothetical protein
MVLVGGSQMRCEGWLVAPATATEATCDAWRLGQHDTKLRNAASIMQNRRHARLRVQASRVSCATGQRRAHRKALGWPLLDVEASQVPVQLSASNRHCSSRSREAAATSTPAASSAPSRHVDSVCVCRFGVCIASVQHRSAESLRVVESEILWRSWSRGLPGWGAASELHFTTPPKRVGPNLNSRYYDASAAWSTAGTSPSWDLIDRKLHHSNKTPDHSNQRSTY